MKLVVVGGVAGGMSAAARARRLDEHAQIVVFEAGPYVSFANCGLPYHVAGEIEDRDSLLLHTPQSLAKRAALDVRINTEVLSIDRKAKTVTARGPEGEYTESYDKLILSPGAEAVDPPFSGTDHPAVFPLRTIPQMDELIAKVDHVLAGKAAGKPARAVVLGAGFIGLEAVEALVHRGFDVTIVEFAPHVLPPLDADLASAVHEELRNHGVNLRLGVGASAITDGEDGAARVALTDGGALDADLVVLSVGVRPRSELAKAAGLDLGERDTILVDENQVTSDPDILACGDAVQVEFADGRRGPVLLAGPANRQGRRAADQALGHRTTPQQPVLATAVVRVFDLVAAVTGSNSRTLTQAGIDHRVIRIHGPNHAGYYPGATQIHLNATFTPEGKLLGAQAVGKNGVDKRIDVLATAIRAGMGADDLAELELTYSPPIGSAKDVVNMLGFVAQNVLSGEAPTWDYNDYAQVQEEELVLDVRGEAEAERSGVNIPGAVVIPLPQLRERLDEVEKAAAGRPIAVHCASGTRSYLAQRILQAHGYQVRNFSGGAKSLKFAIEAAGN
ncbi:MAG: FAD-dependent oxidoreductase [Actinomycetaceae bacterium]|nr:FAD-dependent oxidoreductase [Actinomycetaceae bacterium]